jgi:hypothetical protein
MTAQKKPQKRLWRYKGDGESKGVIYEILTFNPADVGEPDIKQPHKILFAWSRPHVGDAIFIRNCSKRQDKTPIGGFSWEGNSIDFMKVFEPA